MDKDTQDSLPDELEAIEISQRPTTPDDDESVSVSSSDSNVSNATPRITVRDVDDEDDIEDKYEPCYTKEQLRGN